MRRTPRHHQALGMTRAAARQVSPTSQQPAEDDNDAVPFPRPAGHPVTSLQDHRRHTFCVSGEDRCRPTCRRRWRYWRRREHPGFGDPLPAAPDGRDQRRAGRFAAATLTVTGTVIRERLRGLCIQQFPKTEASQRVITLAPQTVLLLTRRLATVPEDADPPGLFPSPQRRLRDPNNTSGDLRAALDRAGYPWVTSHTFRRTVATASMRPACPPARSPTTSATAAPA